MNKQIEYTLETQKDGDMWAIVYRGCYDDCIGYAVACIADGFAVRIKKTKE